MRRLPFWSHALLICFVALGFVACDSGGEDPIDTSVLVGTYRLSTLTFEPDVAPSVLQPVNVMDTLVVNSTILRFSANERFVLEYSLRGASTSIIFVEGTYVPRSSDVRLRTSDSFETERRRLLLPDDFRLNIGTEGQVLNGSIDLEDVDLTDYAERFEGLGPIDGTLQIRFQKQR